MPEPLLPHHFSERLARMREQFADQVPRMTLNEMAAMGERQAKTNAHNGSHPYGTPTPAQRGQGPAVITGDLRRAIGHTRAEHVGGLWRARVGVPGGLQHGGVGGGRGRTKRSSPRRGGGAPMAVIAHALDSGNYPFLTPAVRFVARQYPVFIRSAIARFVRRR